MNESMIIVNYTVIIVAMRWHDILHPRSWSVVVNPIKKNQSINTINDTGTSTRTCSTVTLTRTRTRSTIISIACSYGTVRYRTVCVCSLSKNESNESNYHQKQEFSLWPEQDWLMIDSIPSFLRFFVSEQKRKKQANQEQSNKTIIISFRTVLFCTLP